MQVNVGDLSDHHVIQILGFRFAAEVFMCVCLYPGFENVEACAERLDVGFA